MKVLRAARITFVDTNPVALNIVVGANFRVAGFALYAPPENAERVFFKFTETDNAAPTLGTMTAANSATIAPDHSFPIEMSRGDLAKPLYGQVFDLRHAFVRGAVGDAVEIYWHEIRDEAAVV